MAHIRIYQPSFWKKVRLNCIMIVILTTIITLLRHQPLNTKFILSQTCFVCSYQLTICLLKWIIEKYNQYKLKKIRLELQNLNKPDTPDEYNYQIHILK